MQTGEPQDASRHAALAASSRRRLLDALSSAGRPLSASDLAEALGLHVTTLRHHLHTLERAGLVVQTADRTARPGRPRLMYAIPSPAGHATSPHKLAEVLARALTSDADAGRSRAERAGHWWAAQEVQEALAPTAEEAMQRTHRLFDRLGFAPRLAGAGHQRHIELLGCPFRDAARAHPEAVCAVHLGLLRGALQRMGASSAQAQLRPFVGPELCIADVTFTGNGTSALA